MEHVLNKGKFYYPASTHYNNECTVVCDMCNKKNISACIGHGESDICLLCAQKLADKPAEPFHDWAAEQELRNTQIIKALQEKGHTCIVSLESYPSQVSWCQEEPCKNVSVVASS
jgi:hypothetical protein